MTNPDVVEAIYRLQIGIMADILSVGVAIYLMLRSIRDELKRLADRPIKTDRSKND